MEPTYFAADRELIGRVAIARRVREVEAEIRDFVHDSRNRAWPRRRLRLRVSTTRLYREARRFLRKPVEA